MVEKEYLEISQIHAEYCEFIDKCSLLIHYTASVSLQEQKIEEIEQKIYRIKQYKAQFRLRGVEEYVNELFHMQCMLNAMRSLLLMWLKIKSSNSFEEAWCCLIDAQEYLHVALKINDYEGARLIETFLLQVEKTIFPKQGYFMSSGHIETIGKCSICNLSFSLCEHIENKVYMGKLCRRVDKKILYFNHVALVEKPKDKRCIIYRMSDKNGNMIDCFTREICEGLEGEADLQAITLNTNTLDFFD